MIFRLGEVCAISHECFLNYLRVPFVKLENGPMKPPFRVEIFDCQGVVLLVREEADRSPTTEWSCGPAQGHRHAAHLLILLAERDVDDRSNAYLSGRPLASPKLQSILLNRDISAGVVGDAFET